MTKGKIARLYVRFPGLYAPQDEVVFLCANGWFDLLAELSASLTKLAASAGLQPKDKHYPRISYVKEKFGRLRVHVTCDERIWPQVRDLLHETELRSGEVCEICGLPAKTQRIRGAYLTLCGRCADSE